jgi:hypothetical protein
MTGAILTMLMYFTADQISHGTPEVTVMTFDTYAECEFYIEQHTPEIQKELEDGLLGYSMKCEVL